MSSNLPRGLPWIDWDEWTTVKNYMYSCNLNDQISALECVAVWKLRGKLPHSVESTAQLLEIGINDHSRNKHSFGSVWRTENELRMQYSLAIIRAVNGLVDSSQQGYFAESIYGLANTIGLPGWFVELRHDATHNQIPSLNVMRAASTRLIEWYYSNYWLPQAEYLKSASSHCSSCKLIVKKQPIQAAETKDEKKLKHQQKMNPDPVPCPLTDGSLTFDALIKSSGSTFITEILIPVFLNSIFTHNMPENTVSMRPSVKTKKLENSCSVWWSRVLKIQESSSKFFGVLSVRLLMNALDSASANFKSEIALKSPGVDVDSASEEDIQQKLLARFDVNWRLFVCRSWTEKLYVQNVKNIIKSEYARKEVDECVYEDVRRKYLEDRAGFEEGLLCAVGYRFELLCDEDQAEIGCILETADMLSNSDKLCRCVVSVLDQHRKEKGGLCEVPGEGEGANEEENGEEGSDVDEDVVDIIGGDEDESEDRTEGGEENEEDDFDGSIGSDDVSEGEDDVCEDQDNDNIHDSSSSSSSNGGEGKRKRESDTSSTEETTPSNKQIPSNSVRSTLSITSTPFNTTPMLHMPKITPSTGWHLCPGPGAWPLGLVPGRGLGGAQCPLYLLREVSSA